MSTRGCVAIGNKKEWKGVYNHFDSYPSGLGVEIYEHLRDKGVDGLKVFAEKILQFDDWRNYLAGGKCKYCGQVGFGQAHSISGVVFTEANTIPKTETDKEILKNITETGYPDPIAKWHSHGDLGEHYTQNNADALFIEWMYIIDAENQKMLIFTNGRAKGEHKEKSRDGRSWSSSNYTHYFVCEVDLSCVSFVPDWEKIEKEGGDLGNLMYEKFNKKGE